MSVHSISTAKREEPTRAELRPARGGGVSDEGSIEQHETLVDGVRIHTRTAGAGEPLVLVHGLLGMACCWDGVMGLLAAKARVYAPDAAGIGSSERSTSLDAGLKASALRLGSWMDAEGIDRTHLLGTSHGGAVAMYFAAMFPHRVRRLVLHAPANPFCVASQPQIRFACTPLGRLVGRRIPHAPGWLHRIALTRMYGDPSRIRPGSLQEYVRSLQVPGTAEHVISILARWRHDMSSLLPLLPRLRNLPVHLLWGEVDRAVSLDSALRLRGILKAPLQILPGLGHLPFEEAPEVFASCVESILFPGGSALAPPSDSSVRTA